MKLDKWYEAEITLGATSDTDDAEGTVTPPSTESGARSAEPGEEAVKKVLEQFTGEIEQVPPQFSAIKVQGRRAYQTARSGGETELNPRNVTVHSIELAEYAYPWLRINAHVGSGTYIRSLARDIGEELEIGGHLSGLRRRFIGQYSVDNAISPELDRPQLEANILPPSGERLA